MRVLLTPLLRTSYFGYVIVAAALAGVFSSPSLAAEPASLPRVGVLLVSQRSQAEVRAALNALGYIEGTSIQVDWKITPEGYEGLRSLAAELVRAKVDILIAGGDAATRAAMQVTSSIPLVFASGDPIVAGHAKTLSHPGTNATGVYVPQPELEAKRIELLMELSPRPRRITYVRNPDNPLSGPLTEFAKRAAITHRVQLAVLDVRQRSDIALVLKRVSRSRPPVG